MDSLVKTFLKLHLDYVDDYKFDSLYETASNHLPFHVIPEITAALMECGVDPHMYMSYIPDRYAHDIQHLKHIFIPGSITSIGSYAFLECKELESVKIDSGVKSIGSSAFRVNYHLKTINLPDTIRYIGPGAFSLCTGLKEIVLPKNLECINSEMFSSSGLEYITIPNSISSIDQDVFRGCSNLKEIKFEGTIDEWNSIHKAYRWDFFCDNYQVRCLDGVIE